MSNYRRNYINGGTWFFTVNLQDRRSHLLTDNIHALRCAIAAVKKVRPFRINAWVVLLWGGDRFCTVKNLEEDAGKADE